MTRYHTPALIRAFDADDPDAAVAAELATGADPNEPDWRGYTPLGLACARPQLELIPCLLEAGADAGLAYRNTTPLLELVGRYYLVEREPEIAPRLLVGIGVLLEAGAPVDDGNAAQTPLHAAIGWGWTAAARLLLDAGADAARLDGAGRTALELAIAGRHGELVTLLGGDAVLAAGPDPEIARLQGALVRRLRAGERFRIVMAGFKQEYAVYHTICWKRGVWEETIEDEYLRSTQRVERGSADTDLLKTLEWLCGVSRSRPPRDGWARMLGYLEG